MLWLNGTLRSAAEARIDPADRGLTLGDGVFETIRVRNGRPVHLDRHLRRLRNGAALLGIKLDGPVPRRDAMLERAIGEVVGANALADAAVRMTLTRGPAPRGVLPADDGAQPTLLITAAPLPSPLPPARAILSRSTRRNAFSPLSGIKSLNYLDAVIARREAAAAGADEAILLDTRGRLSEATAANLFVVLDRRILTPPLADGALPGITRARLLEGGFGTEASLVPEQSAGAAAAFLSSSLGLRPLASIGDRMLDAAHPALQAVRRWWNADTPG